ncbi:MAG: helix-turn-helix domain-containing protein [Hyphomicrobiaceae bacterium]
MKTCNVCGDPKPLTSFYANGPGRIRPACIACERKLPPEYLAALRQEARELHQAGMSIKDIAEQMLRSKPTISKWLRQEGAPPRRKLPSDPTRKGDPDGLAPIGAMLGSDKWGELDRAIIAARIAAGMVDGRRRSSVEPWPSQSSIVREAA